MKNTVSFNNYFQWAIANINRFAFMTIILGILFAFLVAATSPSHSYGFTLRNIIPLKQCPIEPGTSFHFDVISDSLVLLVDKSTQERRFFSMTTTKMTDDDATLKDLVTPAPLNNESGESIIGFAKTSQGHQAFHILNNGIEYLTIVNSLEEMNVLYSSKLPMSSEKYASDISGKFFYRFDMEEGVIYQFKYSY